MVNFKPPAYPQRFDAAARCAPRCNDTLCLLVSDASRPGSMQSKQIHVAPTTYCLRSELTAEGLQARLESTPDSGRQSGGNWPKQAKQDPPHRAWQSRHARGRLDRLLPAQQAAPQPRLCAAVYRP